MTALVRSIRSGGFGPGIRIPKPDFRRVNKRAAAVAALVAIVSLVPGGWSVAFEALSEAYLSVAVFVAGTLALVFTAERAFNTDLGSWLQRYQRWQVPAAALLGAFPGCGGAIVAVTQYTRGYLSFGGVVATLTATMGDAMFLLLAREPQTAVGVLALGIVVGVISGYVIDAIHGPDFMRPARAVAVQGAQPAHQRNAAPMRPVERVWMALMVPGAAIGVLGAFQVDVDEWLADWSAAGIAFWLGAIGSVLAIAMWVRTGDEPTADCSSDGACAADHGSTGSAVVDNTNFVTAWVAFAFVGYELVIKATGVDLGSFMSTWGPLVPAMAILVGFIPGCGPQIMVTSLYLAGSIPLSAQLANAIANDGDALFPAIAVAPKAAMVASVYSAIPAVLVGYGWYGLVEGTI
jgi:hypothetical protein